MSGEAARLLASLASPAFFTLAGLGLAARLPALATRHAAIRAAYAYLLGLAGVSSTAYLLSHLAGVPLTRTLFVALGVVGFAPALAGRRRNATPKEALPQRPNRSRRVWGIAALGVGTIVCLGVLAEAVTNPVRDFDGQLTWGTQARYVRAEGTVDARVLRDPTAYVSNPRHPLLMPLAQVAAYELFEMEDDRVVRPIYAALLPAFLLIFYDAASRLAGARAAAIGVLLVCASRMIPFAGGGGAAGTYSDFPLGCFFGGGLALLLTPRQRAGTGLAAGLLLAAAILTKNEGVPLAIAALGAALVAWPRGRFRRGGWRAIALAGLLAVLAVIFLADWRSGIPARFDQGLPEAVQSFLSSPSPLRLAAGRLVAAFPGLVSVLIRKEPWGYLWLFAGLSLAVGWRGLNRRMALSLLVALAGTAACVVGFLCVAPGSAGHVPFFWPRLLVHAALPSLLLVALAQRGIERTFARPRA